MCVVLAIGGCAGVTPPPPPPKPAAAASVPSPDQRAAAPAALAVERQWLQSWFQGTPVLIAQRGDGALTIEVPREFCFDPGRSEVKPALAAVLNKVAESMRRVPPARLAWVAAPDDAHGNVSLAPQRATQVHKHLLSQGVPAARMGKPTATAAAAVQLRMETVAP
jgi:outer membrane protein OmpA-like peptidoglycan-associated protein